MRLQCADQLVRCTQLVVGASERPAQLEEVPRRQQWQVLAHDRAGVRNDGGRLRGGPRHCTSAAGPGTRRRCARPRRRDRSSAAAAARSAVRPARPRPRAGRWRSGLRGSGAGSRRRRARRSAARPARGRAATPSCTTPARAGGPSAWWRCPPTRAGRRRPRSCLRRERPSRASCRCPRRSRPLRIRRRPAPRCLRRRRRVGARTRRRSFVACNGAVRLHPDGKGQRVVIPLEQGIVRERLLDFLVQLDGRQLQQADRLLQLGRERQVLRQPE